eukprot:Anaeramoba_ignava/a608864_6.p1 GENE.a608864_6~~a608864_6.p1  ORF type:complete len:238 (+),score=44.46 a608864_6:434-1147(+)
MKKLCLIFSILILFSTFLSADLLNYKKLYNDFKAKRLLKKNKKQEAVKLLEENAIENPDDNRVLYNLGTVLSKDDSTSAAQDHLNLALREDDKEFRSKAYQNLGNSFAHQKKYMEALKSYQKALHENPENDEARYNFELVNQIMLKQQQQQQKQNQDKDSDNKDKKKQQKQSQQDKQDPSDKKEEQQQQMKKQEDKDKKKDREEKILEDLMKKEKENRDKKKEERRPGQRRSSEKFW